MRAQDHQSVDLCCFHLQHFCYYNTIRIKRNIQPKWWDIGIRIEDDILVTKNGPVNLSAAAPRAWDEIEKLMAEESPLDDFKLPALEIN